MANLSQGELQNLRHLIGAHETSYQKLNTYASQAVDPQIKEINKYMKQEDEPKQEIGMQIYKTKY